MQLSFLSRNDLSYAQLFPIAAHRIKEFCDEVKWDIDQDLLIASIVKEFEGDDPRFSVGLFIEDDRIAGHILATFDRWYLKKYLTVLQYKWDSAVQRDVIRQCFGELINWAKSHGCTDMQAMVPDAAHERRLRTFYEFEKTMIVMRRPL